MKRFHKVAVLKGGPSAEREVSLRSGGAVAKGLGEAGYDVTEIDVTASALDIPPDVEAVFVALHGEFGEDGQVQRLLEKKGIPYTGSGPDASEAAFDKKFSKKIFAAAGIPTPEFEIIGKGKKRTLALPVVIKPLRQGSSIGVHRIFREDDWKRAFSDTLKYGSEVLVERYIEGRELTVGIVGTQVLCVIEIAAPEGWYNYEAKYTAGKTEYRVPAPIPEDAACKCREAAWRTFESLGCRGFGRVDMRMSPDGRVYVLELNSIPGFTETSLLPMAAKNAGMNFPKLCDRIMSLAALDSKK